MKISVVIPVYNEEHLIQQCLLALNRQSVEPYEVIVVDNGSNDETAKIAKQMGAQVLHEPRRGILHARNCGFSAAKGGIIARIDADTVVPDTWIEQLGVIFENSSTQAVTGPAVFYDVPLPRAFSFAYQTIVFDYNRLLMGHDILWGSNMAVRKGIWQNLASEVTLSTKVHEDLDLALVLKKHGYNIRYLPQLTVLASMRTLYGSPKYFKAYIQMWYATLQLHGYRTYGLDKVVGLFLRAFQPLVARLCYRYLGLKFRWGQRWFESPDRSAQ